MYHLLHINRIKLCVYLKLRRKQNVLEFAKMATYNFKNEIEKQFFNFLSRNLLFRVMTASVSRICYLQPTDAAYPRIDLPHNEEVAIADDGETIISNIDKSQAHIIVNSDVNTCTVSIKTLGEADVLCNGYRLRKDATYEFNHGYHIQFHLRNIAYKINFFPPPEISKTKSNDSETNQNQNETGWEVIDNKELLVYTPPQSANSTLIASFDLDGTLIKTKSGARFPKDDSDWELNFGNVKSKLRELHSKKYKLVIFTNQASIDKSDSRRAEFEKKIESIVKHINLPIQVFLATGHSIYRKPVPGMWYVLTMEKNGGLDVDMDNSFFVGDAAGRAKNWALKKPKDHSLADRLFAMNIGLKFHTPEEYFLGAKAAPFQMPRFDPRTVTIQSFSVPLSDRQEVIIMVGSPGSGKSFFCEKHLISMGYVRINRDSLGSWQKCVKVMEESLLAKKNVVIDNTNATKESRKRYIDVVKKHNILCKCFWMSTNVHHAKHNNKFRELTDQSHMKVSEIIINSYYKQFETPTVEEGFDKIVEVPFVPTFANEKLEKLYKMFLLSAT